MEEQVCKRRRKVHSKYFFVVISYLDCKDQSGKSSKIYSRFENKIIVGFVRYIRFILKHGVFFI